jgi:uncharacterized membrane protein (DUF2068 family)
MARPRRGLKVIAAFKFVKAGIMLAAGFAALGLLSPPGAALTGVWLEHLALGHGHRLLAALAGRALPLLSAAGTSRLLELAIGAFLYASLFLVEGVGLAQGRRWAESLAVISTSALLPLEGLALWHHPTLIPAGTIILNVAVVVYLILHLSTLRQPSAPHRWHA